MRALITGGAGLLGAALSARLVAQGARVTVFDPVAEPRRLRALEKDITVIRGDVGDLAQVLHAVRDNAPDVIFHLGALLGFACEEQPGAALRINAMGTYHVLEAARLFGVPQVMFASSITTFAEGLPEPLLRDDFPQNPVNFYGVLKLLGEGMGRYYARRHGVGFRAIRFPSVVGPGNRIPGLVTYTTEMIEAALNFMPYVVRATPEVAVPLIHVDDCARALCELFEAPADRLGRAEYLVDGAKPTPSAGQLAEMVRAHISTAEISFRPDPDWQPFLEKYALPIDDSAARGDWGWQPRFDYPAIIEDFAAAHKEKG